MSTQEQRAAPAGRRDHPRGLSHLGRTCAPRACSDAAPSLPRGLALAPGRGATPGRGDPDLHRDLVLLLPASRSCSAPASPGDCASAWGRRDCLVVATLAALLAAGLLAARGGCGSLAPSRVSAAGLAAAVSLALVAATAWLVGRDTGTAEFQPWAGSDRATAGDLVPHRRSSSSASARRHRPELVDPLGLAVGDAARSRGLVRPGAGEGVGAARRWRTAIDLAVIVGCSSWRYPTLSSSGPRPVRWIRAPRSTRRSCLSPELHPRPGRGGDGGRARSSSTPPRSTA